LNLAARQRPPKVRPASRGPRARFPILWHLAWALGTSAAAIALGYARRFEFGPDLAPVAAGIAPAFAGAALANAGDIGRRAALCLWIAGVTVACLLTGGATGPLAAWCLAPLAAAAAYGAAELLPLGAAGALAAAAVCVLSSVLLPLPVPAAYQSAWFALLAMGGVAVGLGSSLVALQATLRVRTRARDDREALLLEVLDNQPQMLVALDAEGRILDSFGQQPPGWRARDLIGRNLGDFAQPDDRPKVEAALEAAASAGSAEAAFRPAQDENGAWELTLRRLDASRIVAAVRDVRAERSRHAELQAARDAAEQQNQAKGRFLANMSHELRTPLNAIMGFSDIMRQRLFGPISDRYAEYAELVHESGAHLLELINDVLDMSKIEAERFELAREIFDAREAVAAALRLMRGQADRAGVRLRGVLPAEALEANADRRAIKQIAINLVSNALKFTPRGGSVTLTLQQAGEQLEVVVADTGVGIGPEDLERLGRPFEQAGDPARKAGGTGLGLSLVRAFAQLHGGEMLIESALGEGTTVVVRLPVACPPEPGEAPSPVAAEA
jgi:cell cycle sensor histidine kinase DivJ